MMELWFKLKTFGSDTMLDHHLSQNLKMILLEDIYFHSSVYQY